VVRSGVTFPKLPQPVTPADVFVAPATLDASRALEAVTYAVKHGILKPADIEAAELAEPALLYVPFWRVVVTGDGGAVMICARTGFPYEAKLPSVFGKITGVPPIAVGTNELVAEGNAREALEGGELVDADIDKARAEAIASGMLVRALSPATAMSSQGEPKPHSSLFCLYPLYYARYRYEGEARRLPGEEYFVAVSGRSGEVVAAKHPSPVRAMTNKLRKLLSFDRR
jgi:hypothetical protein